MQGLRFRLTALDPDRKLCIDHVCFCRLLCVEHVEEGGKPVLYLVRELSIRITLNSLLPIFFSFTKLDESAGV